MIIECTFDIGKKPRLKKWWQGKEIEKVEQWGSKIMRLPLEPELTK